MASGESMVWSSRPGDISLTLGVSIWPSMTAWATCIPCGPNSRAMLWASARKPNLPTASAEKRAPPRRAAGAAGGGPGPRRAARARPPPAAPPQADLAARERREAGATAQGRGRPGEEHRAAARLDHGGQDLPRRAEGAGAAGLEAPADPPRGALPAAAP